MEEGEMKSIYRSEEGKNKILELYDSQLNRLSVPWKDIYVQTSDPVLDHG